MHLDRAQLQLCMTRQALAGTSELALGYALALGEPSLRAGDAVCIEPSSEAREYRTATSVVLTAAGAGAAGRGVVSGVLHVQVSPPLQFGHPAQTAVRTVRALASWERPRQTPRLAERPLARAAKLTPSLRLCARCAAPLARAGEPASGGAAPAAGPPVCARGGARLARSGRGRSCGGLLACRS